MAEVKKWEKHPVFLLSDEHLKNAALRVEEMGCGGSKLKAAMEKAGEEIAVVAVQAGTEVVKEAMKAGAEVAKEAVEAGKEEVKEAIEDLKDKVKDVIEDLKEDEVIQVTAPIRRPAPQPVIPEPVTAAPEEDLPTPIAEKL